MEKCLPNILLTYAVGKLHIRNLEGFKNLGVKPKKIMMVAGWGSKSKDKLLWRSIIEEAKNHPGCSGI